MSTKPDQTMQALAIITAAITAVEQIVGFIAKVREHARQNQELTPEQDSALDDRLKSIFAQPHWQPDDKPE